MKNIYIDSEFKCHITNDGTMIAVETDFFDGKCQSFIEGYRVVPAGYSWTRYDGAVFTGEMITPWKDYKELIAAQSEYERDKRITALEEENAMLRECLLEISEVVYA